MSSARRALLLSAAAAIAACQPPPQEVAEAGDALSRASTAPVTSSWSDEQQRPTLVTGTFPMRSANAESAACEFLASFASSFHLDRPGLTLALQRTHRGAAGEYLRFDQLQNGVQV